MTIRPSAGILKIKIVHKLGFTMSLKTPGSLRPTCRSFRAPRSVTPSTYCLRRTKLANTRGLEAKPSSNLLFERAGYLSGFVFDGALQGVFARFAFCFERVLTVDGGRFVSRRGAGVVSWSIVIRNGSPERVGCVGRFPWRPLRAAPRRTMAVKHLADDFFQTFGLFKNFQLL